MAPRQVKKDLQELNRERQRHYREMHKDALNEKRRIRHLERMENNKCTRCNAVLPKNHDKKMCPDCLEYNRVMQRERKKPKTAKTPGTKVAEKTVKAAKATKSVKSTGKTATTAAAKKKTVSAKPVKKTAGRKKTAK
ncbi:MAG: hypothetical protein LBV52_01775 [Spirochaetaceae bacterium]|jgi:predicted RNA-binding Zn-ribbon protein involved in translation (DUF1610 family)|nr:hypothetical protein [Spirochaetaceae bacterium]